MKQTINFWQAKEAPVGRTDLLREVELGDRDGDAVKISLGKIKSQLSACLPLFFTFNPFGYGGRSKVLGHSQKRGYQMVQSFGRQMNLAN